MCITYWMRMGCLFSHKNIHYAHVIRAATDGQEMKKATNEKMIEPLPTDELLEKYPDYKDLFHKPDFLLIKANKYLS